MTDYSDYFYLGKITKKHGFDGRVYIYLDTDEPDHYVDLKMVYIDMGGTLVPYFIEELSIKGNKALVMISDVDSEDADNLINKELYLPIDQLPELKGNKFYYHEAKGMVVKDRNHGIIGTVNSVLEYPNQAVIQVFRDNREVLIPISEDIIVDFNRSEKTIYVETPEGLLDVYLKDWT